MILRSAHVRSIFFFAIFSFLLIFAVLSLHAHDSLDHKAQKTHRHPELELPQSPPNARSSAAFEATQLSTEGVDASCVCLTHDRKNLPIVSWIEKSSQSDKEQTRMFFADWDPKTTSFKNPREIPIPQNTSIHEEGMPKLAFRPDGSIFVLFESSVPSEGSPWGITTLHYLTSDDHGKTWSNPQPLVADSSLSKSQTFSGMTELNDGSLGIAWIDNYTNPQTQAQSRCVMFARFDKDNSLSKPVMVESRACECCRIAVTQPSDDCIQIVYRGLRNEATRDLAVVTSFDNGSTFSQPKSFSNDQWELKACPHNGPSIASVKTDDATQSYVTWYAGGESPGIRFAALDKSGNLSNKQILHTKGHFTQVCTLENGTPVVAYNQTPQDDNLQLSSIHLCSIADSQPLDVLVGQSECNATYPVLAPIGNQQIIVAWRDSSGIFYRLITLPTKLSSQDAIHHPSKDKIFAIFASFAVKN